MTLFRKASPARKRMFLSRIEEEEDVDGAQINRACASIFCLLRVRVSFEICLSAPRASLFFVCCVLMCGLVWTRVHVKLNVN